MVPPRSMVMYTLYGVRSVANFITANGVSIKPRLAFSICNAFFVSKGNLLDYRFTTLLANSADDKLANFFSANRI